MILNPLQRAFSTLGKVMVGGSVIKPLFPVTVSQMEDVLNALADKFPLIKAWEEKGVVTFADRITIPEGDHHTHMDMKTCVRMTHLNGLYYVSFTHDLLDGWSFSRLVKILFRAAETGDIPDIKWGVPLGKIPKGRQFAPRHHMFLGEQDWANQLTIPVTRNVFAEYKKSGSPRMQDFLGSVVCPIMGNPNVMTSIIKPGHEEHFGHYSLYGMSCIREGMYVQTVAHEALTRALCFLKASMASGTYFVGSNPLGEVNYEAVDSFQYLRHNHVGRLMLISANGEQHIRLSFNKAIADWRERADKIINRLEGY